MLVCIAGRWINHSKRLYTVAVVADFFYELTLSRDDSVFALFELARGDFFYDFLCYDKIGIELKAFSEITGEFESQLINYLHVGHHQLGLLLNFGTTSLEYKFVPNHDNFYHRY